MTQQILITVFHTFGVLVANHCTWILQRAKNDLQSLKVVWGSVCAVSFVPEALCRELSSIRCEEVTGRTRGNLDCCARKN